ncbi:alpha/beta fold hydrolase [Streptacidiphilus jiangxiensis]|uniref:alpha/beta fold hydrolase n=1 Tax=Streptacidiphilus jiangxiensis TaxID=235985 RepID=UPI000AA6679A|nr:alpha/beta fold hydrolase [Streptacidiphilus jiangxiensis]
MTAPPPGPALAEHPAIPLLDYDRVAGTVENGSAPGSMLLVHGFGGGKQQLRELGDALCPAGSEAFYPVLRAHGTSPKPAWGYSVLDFAADVHRIADVLPERVDAVGYSYGALVSAVSAVTWGAARIRSLVVIDQSFEAHPERHEADEWVEGSLLRWHYDFSHLLDVLHGLGVPVLVLGSPDSGVIGTDEEERLLARRDALFDYRRITGSHAECYRDTEVLVPLMDEFYRTKVAGT